MKLIKGESEADVLLRGAYLYSWKVKGKDVLLRGNLYRLTRGGMAILIPYANRVKGGEYTFDGVKYSLPKNKEGNAIHGLIMDKVFSISSYSSDSITLQYELRDPGYPTTILCSVSYNLGESSLSTLITVKNVGDKRAPLTVGAHPYFLVSDDWRINVKGGVKQCLTKDKIPTGELVEASIEHKNYDDCFLVEGEVELVSSYSSIQMTRENLPFIQIYTGVKAAVAIEPMSGAPDAYNNGLGLKIINPKEEFSYKIYLEIKE